MEAKALRAYVHPIVPVLDITRPTVKHFNSVLGPKVRQSKQLQWLDFFDKLLRQDGSFDLQYALDGEFPLPFHVSAPPSESLQFSPPSYFGIYIHRT